MKSVWLVLAIVLGLLISPVAFAGTICPFFPGDPVVGPTGCNILITIADNGSIFATYPDSAHPYDGDDDVLVGVLNNSPVVVAALIFNNGPWFAFDGDGIDTYTGVGNGMDPTGYGGANAFFAPYSVFESVNFIVPIGSGDGKGYFSLEKSFPPTGLHTNGTSPEPSSLLLLGTGAIGMVAGLRRRFMK